jgi:hypothetical protein
LIFLKTAFTSLIGFTVILAIVLFGVHISYENKNSNYQNILKYSASNVANLGILQLMARSYLNIHINLEPNNSSFVANRSAAIEELSAVLLEDLRINVIEL